MNRHESAPHRERGTHLRIRHQLADRVQIDGATCGKYFVQDDLGVGGDSPTAGERLSRATWIDTYGMANLSEGLRVLTLPQKKISIAPRNLGRQRINALGLEEGIARA